MNLLKILRNCLKLMESGGVVIDRDQNKAFRSQSYSFNVNLFYYAACISLVFRWTGIQSLEALMLQVNV